MVSAIVSILLFTNKLSMPRADATKDESSSPGWNTVVVVVLTVHVSPADGSQVFACDDRAKTTDIEHSGRRGETNEAFGVIITQIDGRSQTDSLGIEPRLHPSDERIRDPRQRKSENGGKMRRKNKGINNVSCECLCERPSTQRNLCTGATRGQEKVSTPGVFCIACTVYEGAFLHERKNAIL